LALLWLWRGALAHPLSTLPSNPFGDLPARFAPLWDFTFSRLRAGRAPLWDPLILGGVPNLGGLESGMMYPPNWLHLVLPLGAALNVLLFLHLWLCAAFTALWARRLGASREGAALAGLAWMLSGPVFPHLFAGYATLLYALAWAPLLYCAIDGWLEEGSTRWLAIGAVAGALQLLSGNPQTAYYSGLVGLGYAVLRARGRLAQPRRALGLAALFALAAALAAAQLLPALEASRECARAGAGYAFTAQFSLPPEGLLTALAPHWLGGASAPYFGRLYLWEASIFVGLIAALLAAACPRKHRGPLLGAAGGALLLALGAHTPLHALLSRVLPGFALFRGSSKFAAQATLFACAAAGLGYDEAARPKVARTLAWAALALAALCAAAAAGVLASGDHWAGLARSLASAAMPGDYFFDAGRLADPGLRRALTLESATAFGAAAFWALAAAACLAKRARAALWAAAALELLLFASAHTALAPVRQPVPPELAEALAADPGDGRFLANWTRHPNLGLVVGRPEAWGYDQLALRRWAELGAWTQGRAPDGATLYQPVMQVTPRLALLRVRYVLLDAPAPKVLRTRAELPRAFLARGVARAEPWDAALARPGFDARAEALVDPGFETEAPARGTAEVRDISTDELEVTAESATPAVVVIADAYSAAWRAEALPGSAQARYEVIPVDHALRGVPIVAGSHRFRLVYEPKTWRLGRALSLAALLVLLGIFLNSHFAHIKYKH
jgi:hypothetical protein